MSWNIWGHTLAETEGGLSEMVFPDSGPSRFRIIYITDMYMILMR